MLPISLKSRSYNLDLDHDQLSLEFFFILSCLMESYLHQLSGSSSIFVKSKHQKAANLELQLILAARMGYTESFEM